MHRSMARFLRNTPRPQKIMLGIIAALVLVIVVLILVNNLSATPDTNIRLILNARIRQELTAAQSGYTQISLLGTSTSQRSVSQTRQHLYAVQLLNDMAVSLLGTGKAPLPTEQVQAALTAIIDCETQIQSGYGMEVPLDALARAIDALQLSAQVQE